MPHRVTTCIPNDSVSNHSEGASSAYAQRKTNPDHTYRSETIPTDPYPAIRDNYSLTMISTICAADRGGIGLPGGADVLRARHRRALPHHAQRAPLRQEQGAVALFVVNIIIISSTSSITVSMVIYTTPALSSDHPA
jgi:hypothetical protein